MAAIEAGKLNLMAAKEDRERGRETTTPRLPDIEPQVFPSGDYTYILEIVMGMQGTMGKLIEAVESLKRQSERQGDKLDSIGRDVHAAKVVISVVGALTVLAGALAGWMITTYISMHPGK